MKGHFVWTLVLLCSTGLSSGGTPPEAISIVAEPQLPTHHSLQKRSPPSDVNVSELATAVHLNTSHLSLFLSWTGEESQYLICVSKGIREANASNVFLSMDDGTTFQDISSRFLLKNGSASNINLFKPHGNEHCTFVFTDVINKHIFTTRDCGFNVEAMALDFSPDVVEFDVRSRNTFLVHDIQDPQKKLFVTHNFGRSFHHVQDYVERFIMYYDAPITTLYVMRATPSMTISNVLSSQSFFQNASDVEVVASNALDFEIQGSFLFFKAKDSVHGDGFKELFIAKIAADGTHGRFIIADLGDDRPVHDYFIVDVTQDNQVLISANFDSKLSNLYTSIRINGHEALFSLSLPRVLYFNPSTTWNKSWLRYTSEGAPFVDVHKVEGLRGVYIANQILPSYFENSNRSQIFPDDLHSLITFDLGALWSPIKEPSLDKEFSNCSKSQNCSLHLSQYLSNKYPKSRSIPILSRASAVGLILGNGNTGSQLSGKSNVYLSADAGLSWQEILKGSYYYNIGDHGGIIVAVKYYKSDGPTNELLYSINEGVTWKSLIFYEKPIRIFGLLTPPGENSTIFTMFGTQELNSVSWMIIKVDLKSVFLRNCTTDDYKLWSPSDSSYGKHKNCLLGRKDIFERRIVHTNCYNGLNYDRPVKVENCHCERSDFQCDFGFIPDDSSPETCIVNPEFKNTNVYEPLHCQPGEKFLRKTGYVKIPGDTCIGGKEKEFSPMNVSCPLQQEDEFLIVNQRVKVSRINLWNMSQVDVLPLKSVSDINTIEYDLDNDCAIWSDGKLKQILVQCFNESDSGPRILVQDSINSVQGMSLDWISRNLYFLDGKLRKIEIVRLDDGSIRKTLIDSKILRKPRGIAVHPGHGYLYYTDWYEGGPSIGRTNMDGTDHIKLIKGSRVVWPNHLSIDFIANRIYWTDSKQGHIGSCDLHGGNLKFMDSAPGSDKRHPFAVAVHKDLIFWDDWVFKSVFVANKNSGKGKKEILTKLIAAMDVKVFSKNLRVTSNACSEAKDICSHLCTPLPETLPSPNKYKCLCPEGMKEAFDEASGKSSCLCPSNKVPPEGSICQTNGTGLCGSHQFTCLSNNNCIDSEYKCNGINDCGDGSDEKNCDHFKECPSHFFTCKNNKCINNNWRCDGDDDCNDNSDEMDCEFKECAQGFFKCDNDQCIKQKYRCDYKADCSDHSDENNCSFAEGACHSSDIRCPSSNKCFPSAWRCDGQVDCADGSDEANCTLVTCKDWQSQCDDGTCIFKDWKCDGAFDCVDKSDELYCNKNETAPSILPPVFGHDKCQNNTFRCFNGKCIPISWKCDGSNDCEDKSDELNCGDGVPSGTTISPQTTKNHMLNMFECKSGKRIWQSWVCNGRIDCPDGGDENSSLCQEKTTCEHDERRCDFSGECIKLDKICDKVVDCADETDEKGCGHDHIIPEPLPSSPCDPLLFSCDNNQKCISDSLLCNGVKDCSDGSDEINCHQYQAYQVRGLLVDEDLIDAESLTIHWWIADISSTDHLLFRPKYKISGFDHLKWSELPWQAIQNSSYTFQGLHPYTQYDMTVDIKLEDNVYESRHIISHRTYPSVPTIPLKLKATQIGKKIKLTWKPPSRPNGIIKSYIIHISPHENPPLELRTGTNTLEYEPNMEFNPGTEYVFSVSAENIIATGNKSLTFSLVFDEDVYKYSIRKVEVLDIKTDSVILRWSALGTISQFLIELTPPRNPFAFYKDIKVDGGSFNYTLRSLAPAEQYLARISPWKNGVQGPSFETSFITPGTPIPIPTINSIRTLSEETNIIEIQWSIKESHGQDVAWEFALYYGASEHELLKEGIRNTTSEHSLQVRNLNACESYIFRVNVIGPYGPGRISPVKTFTTPYSLLSPPNAFALSRKENDANSVILSWGPPCTASIKDKHLGYLIHIRNLITGGEETIHLTRTNYIHNVYTFRGIRRGGLYEMKVRTDVKNSVFSPSLSFEGPKFPAPVEFTGRTERATGHQLIFWAPSLSEEELGDDDKFTYNLYMAKEDDFRDAEVFRVSRPPYVISQELLEPGEVYFLTVEAVTSQGYKSRRSPPITLERPSAAAIVVSESGAAGIIVPIFLFIIALVVLLAIYAHRHRKLKNRFKQFASRYSSTSGATILSQTILNEEDGYEEENDAPIIRGFSDSEPLVIS